MLGGAYIGVALILALTVGSASGPAYRSLLMGLVFGIGLILVIFAGAELFTGYALYMTFGLLHRTVDWKETLRAWAFVWLGNLIGAAVLSAVFVAGGTGSLLAAPHPFLFEYTDHKISADMVQLFCRAALCNWLVCLAIWTAARVGSESAKMIAMAWCLLAFVACGFEHSVANMTAFSLSLFAGGTSGTVVMLAGGAYNLVVVTLGNLAGGGIFVALAYAAVARSEISRKPVEQIIARK